MIELRAQFIVINDQDPLGLAIAGCRSCQGRIQDLTNQQIQISKIS